MSDWIYVDSSNLDAIRYNGDQQELQVRFKDGSEYAYDNVPEHVFEGLRDADSKGSYLHREVKGKFAYHKL